MSKSVKTLDELRDSRILYDKKVPPFGYIIVLIVLALLVGVVIWSLSAPKVYVIKANGTVTNADANYVMSAYTGSIINSRMVEGMLVTAGEELFTVRSADYDLQVQQLKETRTAYEDKKSQYEKLVRSIQDNTNYFNAASADDTLYYSAYETYQAQVAQNSIDTSTYKSYGYTDEQIAAAVAKNSAKITEVYYTAIQSAENSISECEIQLASIDAQLSALENGQTAYTMTAPVSGTLHLLADYKTGMVAQTGSAIASITPENEDALIEAYVSTADRARMHEGDTVEIAVSGLTQTVYGTISGTVAQIDSNVTTQESGDETSSVFKVKIHPDSTYLVSRDGEQVTLSNGLSVEARIQYDKVTYFNYVIEKLGFKI
ncbi:MAG: HlyD family efflux transporter periplasmic adaptor subunit [Candidatus Fimivivens sp.]|nr:HlyD family efflux transporter periplasmic adaptor subunit [Candidatus Fimivivens sp.]